MSKSFLCREFDCYLIRCKDKLYSPFRRLLGENRPLGYFRDECVVHGCCVSMWQGEKGDTGLMGLSGARGLMGPKVSHLLIPVAAQIL